MENIDIISFNVTYTTYIIKAVKQTAFYIKFIILFRLTSF